MSTATISRIQNQDENAFHTTPREPSGSPRCRAHSYQQWSKEDSYLLVEYKNEGMEWDTIANRFPGRTAIACERRHEYIRKNGAMASRIYHRWSRKDSEYIIELKEQKKMKWKEIATKFPGTSVTACKQQYHAYKKKGVWSQELKKQLAGLCEQKMKIMWLEIAAEMGVDWRDARKEFKKQVRKKRITKNPVLSEIDYPNIPSPKAQDIDREHGCEQLEQEDLEQ